MTNLIDFEPKMYENLIKIYVSFYIFPMFFFSIKLIYDKTDFFVAGYHIFLESSWHWLTDEKSLMATKKSVCKWQAKHFYNSGGQTDSIWIFFWENIPISLTHPKMKLLIWNFPYSFGFFYIAHSWNQERPPPPLHNKTTQQTQYLTIYSIIQSSMTSEWSWSATKNLPIPSTPCSAYLSWLLIVWSVALQIVQTLLCRSREFLWIR